MTSGKRKSSAEFIEEAKQIHGNFYDYSQTVFSKTKDKTTIICPVHGPFLQSASLHVHLKCGCPLCSAKLIGKKNTKDLTWFKQKAERIHGKNRYDYSKSEYINNKTKTTIVCPFHGDFLKTPNEFLTGKKGCPTCSLEKINKERRFTVEEMEKRCAEVHGTTYFPYTFLDMDGDLVKQKGRLRFTCAHHGIQQMFIIDHVIKEKKGCIKCKDAAVASSAVKIEGKKVSGLVRNNRKVRWNGEVFRILAEKRFGDKFDYSLVPENLSTRDIISVICKEEDHGPFEVLSAAHIYSGVQCPKCSLAGRSNWEVEVEEFLKSNGFQVKVGHRLKNRLEIDLLIENRKIGIECNGFPWHTSYPGKGVADDYHLKKTLAAQEEGIHVIHLFWDDWCVDMNKTKAWLLAQLGGKGPKHFARKLEVREVHWNEVKHFVAQHHIQGIPAYAEKCFALYTQDNVLVSAMLFSERFRDNPGGIFLERFCSSGNIVGGFSKLVAAFIKIYGSQFDRIISYSDRSWTAGGVYEKNGFSLIGYSSPSYSVVEKGVRRHRIHYQRKQLKLRFPELYSEELTEREICEKAGLYRCYDCGKGRWEMNLKDGREKSMSSK